jgi:hypothetical protein
MFVEKRNVQFFESSGSKDESSQPVYGFKVMEHSAGKNENKKKTKAYHDVGSYHHCDENEKFIMATFHCKQYEGDV